MDVYVYMDGRMYVHVCMYGWMDVCMYECMYAWMNECMYGWMCVYVMDGWMYEWRIVRWVLYGWMDW